MPVGGARPGAGRPKGVPNKVTLRREAEIASTGLTPLGYMLKVLRSKTSSSEDKRWAAQTAAPYVHPRLSSAFVDSQHDHRIEVVLINAAPHATELIPAKTLQIKYDSLEELEGIKRLEELEESGEHRRGSSDSPAPVDLATPQGGELVGDGETQHVDSDAADNHWSHSNEGES